VTRLLAIMGSGETAPTMVKPHRQIFEALGSAHVPAVILDTPYGFQANADDITAKAIDYFRASVGHSVEAAELRRKEGAVPARREQALARLAAARWVFAGPGSPTYSLRQWRGTEVPDLLADKLERDGAVVFASAAALTLGRRTVPVYEIYKVGTDPEWEDGLDLLSFLGPDVAVVPHYDNAEGGNHDTRFCYLGEGRLARLEEQMSGDGWVLGVDEHTGCIFDLDAGRATIVGNGVVTIRRRGSSATVPAGMTLTIAELAGLAAGPGAESAGARASAVPSVTPAAPAPAPTSLHTEIARWSDEFDQAIAERDVEGAVNAVLGLDSTLVSWSGDTHQSDASDRGRATLRRMVARLGQLAQEGARDPRQVVGGFVEALLAERAAARAARRYEDADRVREALVKNGIEVRDSPDGTAWAITGD